MNTPTVSPPLPNWATTTYADGADICHDRQFEAGVLLHRRDSVVDDVLVADDTWIITEGGHYFTPANARKLAAALLNAADMADQG